jgi:UDP-N-acetylmuramoyl-L-alanyl-D-glutamate--2,6-diaminopimelate ligase
VLLAGKGHEKYQVIGSEILPFDDVAIAREALDRKRSRSGVA